MKKTILILCIAINLQTSFSQSICNNVGNLMLFTNYDGGSLVINVDANIPNLKIGIVSYEAVAVSIIGTFSNNVTGIVYAGFNSTNTNCSPGVPTTTFSGVPTLTPTISFAPAVTLTNSNGYSSIICGYSCSNTTNQGGCNTRDQIEAYFVNVFPSSPIYAHKIQYGCWTGAQTLSSGGTCCNITTGINKNSEQHLFSIYPNPFNHHTNIEFQSEQTNTHIKLTDLFGKEISTQLFSGKSLIIEKGTLSEGVYFLQITDEDKNTTNQKIIIH